MAIQESDMIWANLLHLSYNMWCDREVPESPRRSPHLLYQPYLRFDESLWNDLLEQMAASGLNMVVIDVGDGVKFESHPEISVDNAWSPDKLRSELAKMRQMGLEPIPKLNFATTHDLWLGDYARQVSTPRYYEVCRNLIDEVVELFDHPRFFHLGMDEEDAGHQRTYAYAVMRQHDLWWHDLYYFVDRVEHNGVQAWVWSDYIWNHRDEYIQRMPKSVLQSNWYYGGQFEGLENENAARHVQAFLDLEEHGFRQVPTGSNWNHADNMENMVAFLKDRIAPERLAGFMTAPWHPTLEDYRDHHKAAIEQLGRAHGL